MAETKSNMFLTSIIPRRIPYELIVSSRKSKGGLIGGIMPLDSYDSRRLIKSMVNLQINKYLSVANIFIMWMKDDESIVRTEYLKIFREKSKLEADLKSLYTNKLFNSEHKSFKKNKRGRRPTFETFEDIKKGVERIPLFESMNQTQLSKALGYKGESGLRNLLKTFNKTYKDLVSH